MLERLQGEQEPHLSAKEARAQVMQELEGMMARLPVDFEQELMELPVYTSMPVDLENGVTVLVMREAEDSYTVDTNEMEDEI